MDSLNPMWLREPNAVGEREIRAVLAGSTGSLAVIEPFTRSKTDIISDILQPALGLELPILKSSWDIVQALRQNPNAVRILAKAYEMNETAFKENVTDMKRMKFTKDVMWHRYVRGFCRVLKVTDDDRVIEQIDERMVPSLAVQFEATWILWDRALKDRRMRMRIQRRNDLFHITVALPYVDHVVTGDGQLQKLISAIRPRLPFAIATVGTLESVLK